MCRWPTPLVSCCLLISLSSCGGSSVAPSPANTAVPFISAAALNAEQAISLTVDLTGSQVIPARDTRATGRARLLFDPQTLQLHAALDTSVADVLSVQIHEGQRGEVGAVIAVLQPQQNGQFGLPPATFLTASQAASFSSGSLYIEVQAATDQIRGQITAESEQAVFLPVLSDLQAKVFTPLCSGCHLGGGSTLPSVMNLSDQQATFNSLVGTYSVSVPELLRVEAGDPDASLLVHKITGTHTVGSRMPLRGSRLDQQAIDAVRQWIAQGAMF